MNFSTKGKLLLMFLILTAGADILKAEIVDRTLAVVNNEVITLNEVLKIGYSPQEGRKLVGLTGKKKETAINKILDQLIERKLKVQRAKEQNLSVSGGDIDKSIDNIQESNGYRSREELLSALKKEGISRGFLRGQLKDKILVAKIVGREVHSKIKITSREIKEYYQKNLGEYENREGVRLRHILITKRKKKGQKKKTEELLKRIRKGEDFGEIAQKYSRGPTASKGGDLGVFHKGDLIPEFREAIRNLKEGEVSGIFLTSFGYNLLQLVKREIPDPDSNADVSREIEAKLKQKQVKALYRKFMDELKKSAYIERFL
ncbi:MAG: peptidylprolyl isomerase [bacterium]